MDDTLTLREFIDAMGEHLIELRKRTFVALIALVVGVVIGMFVARPVMDFLCRPIGGIDKLRSIEVTENVSSVFSVSLLFGIILASPVIIYEALAFIIPALTSDEKHYLYTFLPALLLFFLSGVVFAYYVILPVAIPFLTSFMGIETDIRPSDYISFSTNMIFWIGVSFEMPMVIYLAAKLRIVNSKMLLDNWRYAVVICAILAMIITPTVDPVNMMILMVPLVALYFLSILFAKRAESSHSKTE